MRIAVASMGLEVAPRFEQCESFMCYTVNHGVIAECQNMPNPVFAPSETSALLRGLEVGTLIVGLINVEVARVFCSDGVEVVAGASGAARTVVEQYLTRTLIGVDEMCHGDDDPDSDSFGFAGAGCALS